MTEGELPGVAGDEIERDGEDDVYADPDQHIEVVGIEMARKSRHEPGDAEGEEEAEVRLGHGRHVGLRIQTANGLGHEKHKKSLSQVGLVRAPIGAGNAPFPLGVFVFFVAMS